MNMDMKLRKFCLVLIKIFCISLIFYFQSSYALYDKVALNYKAKTTRLNSDSSREVTDLGNGRIQVLFSNNGVSSKVKLEMVGNDGSIYNPSSFGQKEKQGEYDSYTSVYGRFDKTSNKGYKSYLVREIKNDGSGGKVLFEEATPELQSRVAYSYFSGKNILELKNISNKKITIENINSKYENEDRLTVLASTQSKTLYPGSTYEVELQPGSCHPEDNFLDTLYVEVNYRVDGYSATVLVSLDCSCSGDRKFLYRVITGVTIVGLVYYQRDIVLQAVMKALAALNDYINPKKDSKKDDKESDKPKGDGDQGPGPGPDDDNEKKPPPSKKYHSDSGSEDDKLIEKAKKQIEEVRKSFKKSENLYDEENGNSEMTGEEGEVEENGWDIVPDIDNGSHSEEEEGEEEVEENDWVIVNPLDGSHGNNITEGEQGSSEGGNKPVLKNIFDPSNKK